MNQKELKENNLKNKASTQPKSEEFTPNFPKKVENLITLTGITTSKVWERKKLSDTPAYCFLKIDDQEEDIPVIFRIREENLCPHHKKYWNDIGWRNTCPWYCNAKIGDWLKPQIRKGSYLQVEGYFSLPPSKSIKFKPSLSPNSINSSRPSFTATSYQLLQQEFNQYVK